MATNYEVIKAQKKHPTRDLVKVTDNGTVFYVSKEPFGPNTFASNIAEMQQSYGHPLTGEQISFQAPTTRISILAAVRDFEKLAKPQIFNSRWLQAGYALLTPEFVGLNLLDAQGQPITDEGAVTQLLTKGNESHGIYLLLCHGAVVPRDTFREGEQDAREFAEGGLARGLEHTPEKAAQNLEAMARTYPRGVKVFSFDPGKKPTLRVAGLDSGRSWYCGGLYVGSYGWVGGGGGYAFGVRQ